MLHWVKHPKSGGHLLPLRRFIVLLGIITLRPIEGFGKFLIFLGKSLQGGISPPVKGNLLMKQMEFVGNRSLVITMISATLIGAVFGLILGDIFQTFGAESMLGAAAGIALSKELAPVFAGFLVTARGGSAMAAEIATMRVNEQIDAMRVMSVDPYGYLVAPRILASVAMMPLLTCIFIAVGVASSFVAGITFFDIDIGTYIEKMRWMVKTRFIMQGMFKASVFGLFISTIGCFKGFYAKGGAKGVGRATTEAVVISLVTILVADYILSYLMMDKTF